MRIAFLARPDTGNGFYRGVGPMSALAERGTHRVRALPVDNGSPQPVSSLEGLDVLHIHRFCEERTWRIAREAKARGAAVVWDDDDNLTAMPKGVYGQRRWAGLAGERRRTNIRRLFRLVDVVTTPSRHLADSLLLDGAPHTEVIGNYVPDDFLSPPRIPHPGVTIGWAAGLEHQADLDRLPVRDALQRLLDERGDVNVVSIGLRLGLRGDRYFHMDGVPLETLTRQLVEFDVGIAPLADIEFNRARSSIKLKEYAAAGVPWLASPIGAYAGLGEKQGGRLVADDDWHAALARLIDKPRDRRKLAKRGERWAADQTLAKHAHLWEACFEQAIGRARLSAA